MLASSPECKFRWVEYLLIIVAALNQLAWKHVGQGTELVSVAIPMALLAVLAVVNSMPFAAGNGKRMIQILVEFVLIVIAGSLGHHKVYRHLYFIIIGKAALLLNGPSLVIMVLLVVLQQIIFINRVEFGQVRFVPLFPSLLNRESIIQLEYVVLFLFTILLFVLISAILRSEQESRLRAEQMTQERDSMAIELERERIARDIHDSLGHALVGVNIQLQLAQKLHETDSTRSLQAIALARGFATRAVSDVRRAVRAVRDSNFDFPASIKELTDAIESGLTCKVHVKLDPAPLPPNISHGLFFMIQEALTNAQRHSEATLVNLELTHNDSIHLVVEDNGIGFSEKETEPGFGTKGMRERVESFGGNIEISSAAGKGTKISITIPTDWIAEGEIKTGLKSSQ
jgi:signal transduction histidine kinase